VTVPPALVTGAIGAFLLGVALPVVAAVFLGATSDATVVEALAEIYEGMFTTVTAAGKVSADGI